MKLSSINEWLTLFANLGVLAGIFVLVVEMQQNTNMMRSQTRDSITEKQMEFYGWIATDRDLAEVWNASFQGEFDDPVDETMYEFYLQGVMREWENSHYQFEQGLFSQDEFEARLNRWRRLFVNSQSAQDFWKQNRTTYASEFRAIVDGMVEDAESVLEN